MPDTPGHALSALQAEAIANLIRRINNGDFGPRTAFRQTDVESALRGILGPELSNTAISAFFQDEMRGFISPAIITTAAGLPGAVPTADPTALPEEGADPTPLSRQEFFLSQTDPEISRRLIANQFGGALTPTGQSAAAGAFNRFRAQAPLTNFGPGAVPLANAFSAFVGAPRATQAGLQGNLSSILSGVNPDTLGIPGKASLLDLAFQNAFPTGQAAFSAGIQPMLAGMNPRVAQGIGGLLQDQFDIQAAQTPELFGTSQGILENVFGALRDRGFIAQ